MSDMRDPHARRMFDLEMMRVYAEASQRFARLAMNEQALACQWQSDLHRFSSALWYKAASDSDPIGAYFRYLGASFVTASALGDSPGTSAYESLLKCRENLYRAAKSLNIPFVLPAPGHLRAIGSVDVAGAGAALTGGRTAEEFFTQEIAPPDSRNLAANALVAILTYLIEYCEHAGEPSRMTALATWSMLRWRGIETHRLDEVLSIAEKHLGPVAWVRVGPYLERAKVRKV